MYCLINQHNFIFKNVLNFLPSSHLHTQFSLLFVHIFVQYLTRFMSGFICYLLIIITHYTTHETIIIALWIFINFTLNTHAEFETSLSSFIHACHNRLPFTNFFSKFVYKICALFFRTYSSVQCQCMGLNSCKWL